MWTDINANDDIYKLMNAVNWFHDSCITNIEYISGAYVGDDLLMYPINSKRSLMIHIQTQDMNRRNIELLF